MGVRGLQTYLERYCPNACYVVQLKSLISDYRSRTGHAPEIVVDAQSCFRMWSEGLDWTLGLEVKELIFRLRKFVTAFADIGAELVFYFGGATPEKKRSTWLRRRLDTMEQLLCVFDHFYEGRSFEELPAELNFIPPNMGLVASCILKNILRCTVYKTIDECDEEIIDHVHKHNSFAIFAQDTDFIVSAVDCIVLSAKNFNIHEMTTLLYDRVELSHCLNIRVDQLPLFSVLVGNDLFPQELLRTFHTTLCRWVKNRFVPFHKLMPAVGNYIRKLPNIPIDALLPLICEEIFKNLSLVEDMRVSYNSYLIHAEPSASVATNDWSRILMAAKDRVKNFVLPSSILKILSERVYECSNMFEDFRRINDANRKPCDLPSATITRPLRRRLYGILLFESQNSNPVVEWCGENLNSYRTPTLVQPTFPQAHHPGLLTLWDEKETEDLIHHKWMLFLEAVSPKISDMTEWSQLESDELVPVVVCYYLFEAENLFLFELDAVLAAVALYPFYNRTAVQSLRFARPDMRALQITMTFLRSYVVVNLLLATCGYPARLQNREKAAIVGNFEGRLFNMTYRKARNQNSHKELCDNNKSALKKFYRMRNVIVQSRRSSFQRRSRRSDQFSNHQ